MGGKSYFCDYCRCFMKNNLNVRKKHNGGLTHNIAKANWLQRFADPRKLLAEESAKTPCTRFPKGFCKFEAMCQFTHYNQQQMQELQKIVDKMQQNALNSTKHKRKKQHAWRYLLPWKTESRYLKSSKRKCKKRLPPSLQPMNFNRLNDDCFAAEWG